MEEQYTEGCSEESCAGCSHSGSWNRGKLQLHQMSGLRKRDQSVRRESY